MSDSQQSIKRRRLYKLLGKLPPRKRKIRLLKRTRIPTKPFILYRLLLDLNGIEPVPAYLLLPHKIKGKIPLIIYNHAYGSLKKNIGKEEILKGRKSVQNPPYGLVLTGLGYAVLCIDHWAFGERNKKKRKEVNLALNILDRLKVVEISTEHETFTKMLWSGRVMWGMMVYDSIKAVDYALSLPFIDKKRIATVGISMGSTMAWWLAALDKRIKVCVDICCLTDIHEFDRLNRHNKHALYYYVPSLLAYFSTDEITALIAPRPHLSLNGKKDPLTPTAGLTRIDKKLTQTYKMFKSKEKWRLIQYKTDHKETQEMRREVISFLKKWL